MKALQPSSAAKNKILKRKLQSDAGDEDEAIKSYGQRLVQARSFPLAKKKLTHIRNDERDHKKKLNSLIRLKRVK